MGEGRAIIIPALRMKKNKNFLHVLLLCSARLEEQSDNQKDSLVLSHQRHLSPTVYLTLLTQPIHTISAYRLIKFDGSRVRTVCPRRIAFLLWLFHHGMSQYALHRAGPCLDLGPVVLFVNLRAPWLQLEINHGFNI